jgi:hypothetical protein
LLKELDQRIQEIQSRITEARKNNQAAVQLGLFTPLLQRYISIETEPATGRKIGFFDKIANLFITPFTSLNEILSVIGVPLFQNSLAGGSPEAQTRQIQISDLQIKIAELERAKAELGNKVRENVTNQVLEFDTSRRDFQIALEVSKREKARMKLRELNFRFGQSETETYLGQLSQFDQLKGTAFREWSRLRAQLAKLIARVAQP